MFYFSSFFSILTLCNQTNPLKNYPIMKKGRKDSGRQVNNSPLIVSATIDEFRFLENLVEKLAYRSTYSNKNPEPAPEGWHRIETSSIEAYVSGKFFLYNNDNAVYLPFTSCFFFTCKMKYEGLNKLAWSNSLS